MLQPMTYDIERDFSPITMVARDAFILTVHPSLPVKTVKELIALAKSKPGELNYGASTAGGPPQLGIELLKSMTGVNIVAVPYKGTAPAFSAVVGGEVHMTVADIALVLPQAKAGRVRAVAVTAAEPTILAPGLPTVASAGLPGYEVIGATGLWAPAKTPAAIVNRVNQEVVRFLNRPEVKERFLGAQQEIVANSPEQFAATIKSEVAKWGKVFTTLGIKKGN
jgi:tripartite-type tricarboxylate transporter receptor subunit TctC